MMNLSIIIPNEYQGRRVDQVLALLFPDFSRAKLTGWLKEGLITINEKTYQPKDKVYGGEQVDLQQPLVTETPPLEAENIPLEIVFEDDMVLVINKPAGLIVHPGAGNPKHTLVNALLNHDARLQDLPRAGIIHRLDKDTTGLLVVAKTLSAHTSLVRQMQERTIERTYLALVQGHVIAGGTLETHYGRHPRHRLKMAVRPEGKLAITQYSVQKHYQIATLLKVKLMTGRTHQIRVHLAHLNHPVIGDPLYGKQSAIKASVPLDLRTSLQQFKRQALHAKTLAFLHPKTSERISCDAPLPADFQSLLTTLDAYLG